MTAEEINSLIENSDKLIMLDFNADWCRPCKNMLPILKDIESFLSEQLIIIKVNIEDEEYKDICGSFLNPTGIPQFVFIKNKQIIGRDIGEKPKDKMLTIINSML